MFDPTTVKKEFPIFYHNPKLVYLDSAATSLKPRSVIEKIEEYYKKYSANVHRGIYDLSEKATEEYESTRNVLTLLLHAERPEEIVFTRGTTEAINLVASSLGTEIMEPEDEIVSTILEHHSNFVPWQNLAFRTGGTLKVIDLNDQNELGILDKNGKVQTKKLKDIITKKTKIFALNYVSNMLGTISPVKEIIKAAKKINPNIITVVDAAQAVPHMKIDVQDIGCDFLAFSSHKMLGPTGVGVLWGKHKLLEEMSPYQFGGDMISRVTVSETIFNDVPHKFEAGTPNIAGVIGLKQAIVFLEYYGFQNIAHHEQKLAQYAKLQLSEKFGQDVTIYGPKNQDHAAGIVTFTLKEVHPHDIAQILNDETVAVRAGHHCTMPLHQNFGIPATVRASFYLYNTEEDVDRLVTAVGKAKEMLGKTL